jgi:hypothetical protein
MATLIIDWRQPPRVTVVGQDIASQQKLAEYAAQQREQTGVAAGAPPQPRDR